MRIFAIGDVHLPGGPRNKKMDVFGPIWSGHVDQVSRNWNDIARDDDVLLLVGDLSWAMVLAEAQEDLAWIRSLRGRIVVIKGNHDFWWKGIGQVREALGPSITALQYSHVVIDGVAIVGTRGWQCPGSAGAGDLMVGDGEKGAGSTVYTENDARLYRKEVGRLRLGLERLSDSGESHDRLVVALHYPPMNPEHEVSGFTELIDEYGADVVVHGHLHGEASIATAFTGERKGVEYHCVSADAVKMNPRLLLDTGVVRTP